MTDPTGEPTAPPTPSPNASGRDELMARWRDARRRRDAAELGSEPWREAAEEIGRIEVEVARVERAMDPPRV
jgi:hypothetical protein